MLKRSNLLLLLLFLIFTGSAQSFEKSYSFLESIKTNELYQEGILFIDRNVDRFELRNQKDSLYYLKGLFHYNLRQSDQSVASFLKMEESDSKSSLHGHFLTAFQYAFLNDYVRANEVLAARNLNDPFYQELKSHQLASVALLERDFDAFDNYTSNFSGRYFQLKQYEDQLLKNREGLVRAKNKSPFLAGLMSAVIPGSGKFYIGKVGEGYTTLLISTIMALQLREAYRKDGSSSTRFMIFAGLFSTLYVANIWGSVLSVKIYKDDFNETFNQAILLNMHVPVRTIFN